MGVIISKQKLKTSWTKYDSVQIIEIIANRQLDKYLKQDVQFDAAVLKAVLGINSLEDDLPNYWIDIYKYPKQVKLFALIATLFTREDNILKFATVYSTGNRRGTYLLDKGKIGTNIRRALIAAGASLENYSRAKEVPYDFSNLFEEGAVGLLMQKVFKNRLLYLGYAQLYINNESNFLKASIEAKFHSALSLSKENFKKWILGKNITEEDLRNQFHQLKIYKDIPGLKVNQWLNEWDDIDFTLPLRRKPDPYFIIISIDARLLKRLSDVHRRKADQNFNNDTSIQRSRNNTRIKEISNYIEGGFPWSTIPKAEQRSSENESLKMPGLLPTAIIANILGKGEVRNGKVIHANDLVRLEEKENGRMSLVVPDVVFEDSWMPEVKPIEIIDGQHRLWAFDETEPLSGNYELPVIIFNNLDRAWQAYLFYTINVKPVKINTSLGYDLYPLLRTQEWLEKSKDGILAYRETRAQEIVGSLWSFQDSPWYQRINMIGESNGLTISQAAFVKALSGTFFRRSRGLYGSELMGVDTYRFINWNRPQQAGFIIFLWQRISSQIDKSQDEWAQQLRKQDNQLALYANTKYKDPAFTSRNSFVARDQGVRAISSVANDFFFLAASYGDLDFNKFYWNYELNDSELNEEDLKSAIELFQADKEFTRLVDIFSESVAAVDWRTISAPFETDEERDLQKKYKGSGGYKEFRESIIRVLANSNLEQVKKYARQID